jgi:CIC family chloride channel protein
VIFAVARNEGRIPFLSTVRSFFTNAVSIGAGASVGPEGPVIELGAGLGSTTARCLRLSPERVRTLVGCGAAAGLAAAFNAPISGAIFALEIVLRDFAVVTFAPIIVAAVLGTALSRALLGSEPTFAVPTYELFSVWELPLYVVLGLAAGLVGVAFTRLTHAGEHVAARIPGPRGLQPILGGAALGVAFLGLPQLYGVGYETTGSLLHGNLDLLLMVVLRVASLRRLF